MQSFYIGIKTWNSAPVLLPQPELSALITHCSKYAYESSKQLIKKISLFHKKYRSKENTGIYDTDRQT